MGEIEGHDRELVIVGCWQLAVGRSLNLTNNNKFKIKIIN
jgi:hypothetical protein